MEGYHKIVLLKSTRIPSKLQNFLGKNYFKLKVISMNSRKRIPKLVRE
jgi:hypothetical protein